MAIELERQTVDAIAHILAKYDLPFNETTDMPIQIPIGRFKDVPRLFNELGFKVGAEVGVYQGDYSKWLLRGIPGLKLYGVDAWASYKGYKDFGKNDIDEAYDKAVANTKGYDCTLIRGWSHESASQIDDGSLDFVFIDGNHSYEHTVRDLGAWTPKVKKGGIVYGHDFDDYTNSRRWREMNVINAVVGWVDSYKIRPWFVLTKNKNKCWLYVQQ